MKDKINEGDVVVYNTYRGLEIGKIARIEKEPTTYHIVPLSKSSLVKKRKCSEVLSVKKILKVCGRL